MLPDLQSVLLHYCAMLPFQVILGITLTSIFTPKGTKAFWLVFLTGLFALALAHSLSEPIPRAILSILLQIVFPVFALRGRMSTKVILCIAAQFIEIAAEMIVWGLWVQITGYNILDQSVYLIHLPEYIAAMFIDLALVACAFWGLSRFSKQAFLRSSSLNHEPCPQLSLSVVFPMFPASQLLLVLMLLFVSLTIVKSSAGHIATVAAVILICLISDALLLVQMQCFIAKRFTDMRAEALEQQVAEYLVSAAGVQEQLRDAARLRHDLRNHLQVVEGLCERSETAAAKAYLDEAAQMLKGS